MANRQNISSGTDWERMAGEGYQWWIERIRQTLASTANLEAVVRGTDLAEEAASDARRREIYWAVYTDGVRVTGPAVDTPAAVAAAFLLFRLTNYVTSFWMA